MTASQRRLKVLVTAFGSGSPTAKSTTWLRAQAFASDLHDDGIDLTVSGTVPPWVYPWGWYSDPTDKMAKLRSRFVRVYGLVTGALKRLAQWLVLPYVWDVHLALRDVYAFTGPPWFEKLFAARAPFFIFEIDDAIWEVPSVGKTPPMWTPERVITAAKLADRMIVGNEYLADWARRYCDDVRIIPTVPDDSIRPRSGPRAPGPCRLAWYGNMTTFGAVDEILPAIAAARERAEFTFELCTHPNVTKAYTFPEAVTPVVTPWDPATEGEVIASYDVGIMPLPDDRWSYGKCASKLIHYMAAGLPTIASPVGMNAEVVVDGETGFFATTPQEWTDAIVQLASDPELRARMGAAGRARFERLYSKAAALPLYAEAVRPPDGVGRKRLFSS